MPIEKFHGVGKKTVERLNELGIFKGKDLQEMEQTDLIDRFGRLGYDLYRKARGISNSPVKSNRTRKSIGSERTYAKLLYDDADIKVEISKNARRVANILERYGKSGRTLVLKVRYADFSTLTKRKTLEEATADFETIEKTAYDIFDELPENTSGIRLLGVTATGLEDQDREVNLLSKNS